MKRQAFSLRILGRECQAYDVSVPVRENLPVWPGDHNRISLERVVRPDVSSSITVTRLTMGLHTGTHVDAPLHHIRHGASLDMLALQTFIRPVVVLDCSDVRRQLAPRELDGADLSPGDGVFFATRNSRFWQDDEFRPDYVSISAAAAARLMEAGVGLVGIDSWSVDAFGDGDFPTHRALLSEGIPIVEGLNLTGVPPGRYEAICLPINITNVEAAPARVLLLREEDS